MKIRNNTPVRSGSVHSGQLERWLGREKVEHISAAMRGWYGAPIALAGVPGAVYADRDGDFVGDLRAGFEATAFDHATEFVHRLRRKVRRWAHRSAQWDQLNAGFTSLSDLIAEASAGKKYDFSFFKQGTTGVVGATNTLWFVGAQPVAGAAAGAAPGGTVPTDATTGAFLFTNPTGGDTLHFVNSAILCTQTANTLLLYDRIFSVTKTMNSTATEAVTGTPSRYQSSTGTADDYSGGNFLIIECRTALAATAHNWTTCLYTDQDGNTGAILPSVTGNASNIANRLDQPTSTWFTPLASGDTGIKALTQMQCSAAVATGAIDFTIGHPIAFSSYPIPNQLFFMDGLTSAFNLTRIFDDACLAFLEVMKPSTTATSYVGMFSAVAG